MLLDRKLVDEYFRDKTKTLSPAFTMAMTIALTSGFGSLITAAMPGSALVTTGGQLTNLGKAVASMAASSTVGIANGTVSGSLDLKEILKNAAISAGTSYLQSSINLKASGQTEAAALAESQGKAAFAVVDQLGTHTLLGPAWDSSLTTSIFGANLTAANVLESAFDASLGAGVQTAVDGGSFAKAFKTSFINSVVALGLADAQTKIGDVFAGGKNGGEGSIGHILLHGLAGCVAAQAQGADCRAGAAGGMVAAFYSGMQKAPEAASYGNNTEAYRVAYDAWRKDVLARAQVLSLTAGFIFSGGEAKNVSVGTSIGTSAVANNYLTHEQLNIALTAERALQSCKIRTCTVTEWAQLTKTVQAYKTLSSANTARLFDACSSGASSCKQMLADARAFNARVRQDEASTFFTGLGVSVSRPGNYYVKAGDQLGYEYALDIDEVAVRYFTRAENGDITYAQAAKAIEAEVLRFDSKVTLFIGGVQVGLSAAGVASCAATGGLACMLAAAVATADASLGINTASKAVAQMLSSKPERTAIENALLKAGYTPEQAAKYLGNAQLLATVLSIGTGGFIAAKGPAGTVRVTGTTVVDELAGPPTAAQLAAAKSYGIDPKWVHPNGTLKWPEENGFLGTVTELELKPGQRFSRYGGELEDGKIDDLGKFASPLGVPFEARSLPTSYKDSLYSEYVVLKPIPGVKMGKTPPYFGYQGNGAQYQLPDNITQLVDDGYIARLK